MNIAVIGWGSIIWSTRVLRVRTRWNIDGPFLPVEFARISNDGRLTLVLCPGNEGQRTYWAMSEFENLDLAMRFSCVREGLSWQRSLAKSQCATQGARCRRFGDSIALAKEKLLYSTAQMRARLTFGQGIRA